MKKFHIVDDKLSIIDSSDNSLSLRMTCEDMNRQFRGIAPDCVVMSTKELNAKLKTLKT